MKPEQVRELLISYRAEKNLTLRQLATKIGGVTFQTLGNIERGATWPRRTTLLKIERFLRRAGVATTKEAA
ncbi:MAG TPA: helix-turn-helix transcriptional regulator [Terriglobia bacterium]|nr:helix-turn-helix transcriptional regulator [Terriglobia bacterium]